MPNIIVQLIYGFKQIWTLAGFIYDIANRYKYYEVDDILNMTLT